MKSGKTYHLHGLLLVMLTYNAWAGQVRVIKSFHSEWYRFDTSYKTYVPLAKYRCAHEKTAYLITDLRTYESFQLTFLAQRGLNVFLNGKLIYNNHDKKKDTDTVHLSIKSLLSISASQEESDVIAFYNAENTIPYRQVWITSMSPNGYSIQEEKIPSVMMRKKRNDMLMVFFLMWILNYVFLKSAYSKQMTVHFSLISEVDRKTENTDSLHQFIPLAWMFVFISAGYGLIESFSSTEQSSARFAESFIFFSVLNLGKMSFTALVKFMYQMKDLLQMQYRMFYSTHNLTVLAVGVASAMVYFSQIYSMGYNGRLSAFLWVICTIIIAIRVSINIFRESTDRNLYLFSYICAAEIVPIIFSVKFLLL
ncbi:MAG: DUF4271 domain-containing protein [Cytophagaceae bacterium]|nr:DUF4271 domain-containing protein [Cytophagaceae bacterium]MDW8457020.1 DUF4271 domain-containing protein [Cytophagaceae bacterium]